MGPTPGAHAELRATVTDADTAIRLGSGDVPVLGTPRVLALCEEATVAVLAGRLPEEQTSVGIHVELEHLLATAVGGRVRVEARLLTVEGRRLVFGVRVEDEESRLVATGRVTRAIVDRQRFLGGGE